MQDKSAYVRQLADRLPALIVSRATLELLEKHGITTSVVPVLEEAFEAGDADGVAELKEALAVQMTTSRFLEDAVLQLCQKLDEQLAENQALSPADASDGLSTNSNNIDSERAQEEPDADHEGFEDLDSTNAANNATEASALTPGEERLRNPWIASGWHADPTDAIDAAAQAQDGAAVEWQEDPEPPEGFTVVVENLPSGYEAMWADELVEKLGQKDGYFCCQLVSSANSSMSVELLFTSKEAARCVVDKAHGMKYGSKVLVAYPKFCFAEGEAAESDDD